VQKQERQHDVTRGWQSIDTEAEESKKLNGQRDAREYLENEIDGGQDDAHQS
jgi:hypothetical protein